MIREFRLPDLGEGLTESEIVNWHVSVGDTVALNQVIADVETAKAVVELPSPYAGTVTRLHEPAGATVAVGAPIVSFDIGTAPDTGVDAASSSTAVPSTAAPPVATATAAPEPARKRTPNLVGYGAAVEPSGRPVRRRRIFDGPLDGTPEGTPDRTPAGHTAAGHAAAGQSVLTPARERPRSTPPVRKLARDLGVDLSGVGGTGADGLIVRDDVIQAAEQMNAEQMNAEQMSAEQEAGQQSAAGAEAREERIPIAGMRRHTAAAMVASAFTAPHVSLFLTVDVTPSMELLERLRRQRSFDGIKLTPLTLAAKAVCLALARHPALNSRWDGEAGEIVRYRYVNLGIAAATPRGLLVPNIKDAQRLDLRGLAEALGALAQMARTGRATPSDLTGGTISITNVGVFGVDAGTPLLNPGEAAILALGAVRRQPWEHQGSVALRQVVTLSLSFDHRLADGEQGAGFLNDVAAVLADPAMVLTLA